MIPIHDDNPAQTIPFVTVVLMVVCALMFIWQISLGPSGNQQLVYELGVVPAVLFGGASIADSAGPPPGWFTLFSAMFLHGSLLHLVGNLLYLWIFGNNVEDAMGHWRFTAFYLVCGVIAAWSHALTEPASTIPMIGASGAISGVLGAYLLLFPHARVLVAIPIGFYAHVMRMPAALVLGLWFLLQIISSAMAPTGQPGVAWMAHMGGFVAGLALVSVFKRRRVRLWQPPRPRVPDAP